MTSLNNVKKIVINGNEINKVVKNYNSTLSDNIKQTSLATAYYVDQAIKANKPDCNFEYNKQHETNISFDELIIKTDDNNDNTYYDQTYNIKVEIVKNTKKFYYPEEALENTTKTKVYLANNAKNFDSSDNYTLSKSGDCTIINFKGELLDNSIIYKITSSNFVSYRINALFWGNYIGLSTDFLEKYCYTNLDCTIGITEDTTGTKSYHTYTITDTTNKIGIPNGSIYVKGTDTIILYKQSDTSGDDWYKNYIIENSNNEIYAHTYNINSYNKISKDITEITISKYITDFNLTAETTQDLTINVYSVDLTCFGPVNTYTDNIYKLYIQGIYNECNLGWGKTANSNFGTSGELHLSSNFFNDENLDEMYKLLSEDTESDEDYPYGNFSNCICSKIYIEKENLNTIIKDDDILIAMLQRILNAKNINIE